MKEITKKAQELLVEKRDKDYTERIESKLRQVRELIAKINSVQDEIKKLEYDYESDKDLIETTNNLCNGSSLTYTGGNGIYPLYTNNC